MSSEQVFYLKIAQRMFILSQVAIFPLYYMAPFNRWFGGDGRSAKFPCSISWMTRKAMPRYMTLCTWLPGWALLLYVYSLHQQSNAAAIQIFGVTMFVTGFVTVVLTPLREDKAMGENDTIHCVAASIYVFCHILSNQWVLGVDSFTTANPCGLGFTVNLGICSICQYLRKDDNYAARALYAAQPVFLRTLLGYEGYLYVLELLFALSENALFLFFLIGMTSGSATGA